MRFGLIGIALSKRISVFQSSSLKVVPISPKACYDSYGPRVDARRAPRARRGRCLGADVKVIQAAAWCTLYGESLMKYAQRRRNDVNVRG